MILDRTFDGAISTNIDDYPDGIVVAVYKPYRWSSADVIRKVKFAAVRHFGKKNLKVGHAGTLDPLATGVLTICIGNACKNAMALQATDKEYVAGVCFGAVTASYDLEKEVITVPMPTAVTREAVEAVLPAMTGVQAQVAPLFSAKQVDGVRAYELARKLYGQGKSLDETASELLHISTVNINSLELLDFGVSVSNEDTATAAQGASSRINVAAMPASLPCAHIRVGCSKGTYIRAFARDLGEKLGTGAFLCSLERTRTGSFEAASAMTVEEVLSVFRK